MIEAIAALGGFSGLAAIIAALVQLHGVRREVQPNHGSSMNDAVRRTEELVRSQARQIGEIRRDAATMHELLGDRLEDHARRLSRLEERT